jgi:hypothetical protein
LNESQKKKQRDDEMKERLALGLLVIAGFIGTLFAAPVLATVAESFLIIEKAEVSANGELEARLITEGLLIPTDGSEGAFGYGILTEDGDAILVATTQRRAELHFGSNLAQPFCKTWRGCGVRRRSRSSRHYLAVSR